MRLGYSLGSLLTIDQVLECAQKLSKFQPDTIWIPETWGMENFSMLSAVSQKVQVSKIGSSIINIYSRSPALLAMGAATIDTLSEGRLVLGLGASSKPIVENFHGSNFQNPISRMEEYVKIIRLVLSGKKINFDGRFFKLRDFSLLIKPRRSTIPIYLAAVNKKMVDLTWKVSDGVIFYLRPLNELKTTIQKMQSKKKIDVSCQLITCISENSEEAREKAKKTLAFYVSVGEIYRNFLANNGFARETQDIYSEYQKSGLESNHQFVTEKMLDSLTVCGNAQECKNQIKRFSDTGLDLPILQFNPIGNVVESFDLLTSVFKGGDFE